jgi:CRISPR-associated protein Csd1
MSVLASLVRAYDRLPDAPSFGYSQEKIGALISLREDGSVAHVVDLRTGEGKKRQPRLLTVPASFKRPGTTPRPFFLWDNSAFALGVSADEGKNCEARRLAFRDFHLERLADSNDAGLVALRRFLEAWQPEDFARHGWPQDMLDQNIVFALEGERLERFLHDRPAARAMWLRLSSEGEKGGAVCLVTGEQGPIARLHPAIKGVWGGQVAGGSIVSFNLDAFTSYGHEQGDNAPVSEAAAFAYTTALNRFLTPGSGHRVQIGDASTVFWAEAPEAPEAAALAEALFGEMWDAKAAAKAAARKDKAQSDLVGERLALIRQGRPLAQVEPRLAQGVRFHVLGLAPNAARLSVRFWWEDSFGALTANYQRFIRDMALEPGPREPHPPLWRHLMEFAVQGKRENVPPNLAGEWMRAILTGARYPATLLAAALMRVRADQEVNAHRAAIVKAVLVRNYEEEVPVALDEENDSPAYQLGRLFAVLEGAQYAALGRVNAPIGDRYYAAASSTPARVFAPLLRGLKVHIADARKRGRGGWIEPRVTEIMARLPADLPRTLRLEDQGRFAVGYYHEKSRRLVKADEDTPVTDDAEEGVK